MRFEACFEPGDDERLHGWEVIEWTTVNENGRIGHCVAAFYGTNAEAEAIKLAEEKQAMYEEFLYEMEAQEWQRYNDQECEYDFA